MTKKLLQVLAGEPVWPPPVWLMRQAGRYLPEYRALRREAGSFLAMCLDPERAVEITLQPVRRFGMDAAILFSDILIVPWGLGQALRFAEGEGPVLPPIRDAAGLAALEPTGFLERAGPVFETVAGVRAALGHETALIGFAGAPWTVACYMVEGRGSRDWALVRSLAYGDPDWFGRLIGLVTETTVAYLAAQIEAGAEAVMLFDSWAGALPPSLFRAYVLAPAAAIVERLKARFPRVPVIGFPRGAGEWAADYARTGVDAVGFDTAADLSCVPAGFAVQGNLDPALLLAGGAGMARAVREICAAGRGRPHIFNLGHGILPETDPAHVAELIRLVRHG